MAEDTVVNSSRVGFHIPPNTLFSSETTWAGWLYTFDIDTCTFDALHLKAYATNKQKSSYYPQTFKQW